MASLCLYLCIEFILKNKIILKKTGFLIPMGGLSLPVAAGKPSPLLWGSRGTTRKSQLQGLIFHLFFYLKLTGEKKKQL